MTEFRLRGYASDSSKYITTSYDAAGRVSARGGAVSETFAYNNLGGVTQHARGGATSNFTFNSLGWLLSEASAIGTMTYGYDAYSPGFVSYVIPNAGRPERPPDRQAINPLW